MLGKNIVAATEHSLASLAAVRAVERGGNAFDAAASASFALSVTQPHLCGLGGDFFALFYQASKEKVYCLNASGWSPASASLDSLAKGMKGIPNAGAGSVVIPGYVRGIHAMVKKFGKLEFSDSLQPAISVAEDGFPIGEGLRRALARFEATLPEGAKRTFFRDGAVPSAGAVVAQKELAACLRELASSGPDAFYRGEPARGIREELERGGVAATEEDFTSYEPEWCEPLSETYNGTEVFEVPPNSMGATTLLILRILEESRLNTLKPNSADRVRVMVEAARTAYAARDRELGDPRFVRFDLQKFLRPRIAPGAKKRIESADTTYFAVADGEGNVLSCIQSLFYNFGSRLFVDKCGFFLNNRGSYFKTEGPNKLEPRKRPLHTLSALMLSRNGKPFVAAGTSGGEYRPQQHALLTTNIVDYSMELEDAIDFPRFLWDGAGGVKVETGYEDLTKVHMWYESIGYPGATGVAQGVQVFGESLKGVCDPRGEGLPLGA